MKEWHYSYIHVCMLDLKLPDLCVQTDVKQILILGHAAHIGHPGGPGCLVELYFKLIHGLVRRLY